MIFILKPTKKPKGLIEVPPSLAQKKHNLPFLNDSNAYDIDSEMFDGREKAWELFRKITSPIKTNEFFKYCFE
jgi:hypothetical protein